MYLVCNGNLLFHGCVPANEDGSFAEVVIDGKPYAGKALFDKADALVRQGFFTKWGTPEREQGLDFFWYMWCGTNSPLFGKDKMTTFERYFITDKTTHEEHKNPYFKLAEHEDFAVKILKEFGLSDDPDSHIINGHVPVKIKKGESPIKANGRIFVIDGGMSKAYQSTTGIAGYTLIYNSQHMILSCHDPFVTVNEAIRSEVDIHSTQQTVYTPSRRKRVADTDVGRSLTERIADLELLLQAYRSGTIKQHTK
jgi:fructose-1,6-bisphosphatase-3